MDERDDRKQRGRDNTWRTINGERDMSLGEPPTCRVPDRWYIRYYLYIHPSHVCIDVSPPSMAIDISPNLAWPGYDGSAAEKVDTCLKLLSRHPFQPTTYAKCFALGHVQATAFALKRVGLCSGMPRASLEAMAPMGGILTTHPSQLCVASVWLFLAQVSRKTD